MPIVSGIGAGEYYIDNRIHSGFHGSDGAAIYLNFHRYVYMPVCVRRAKHIVASLGLTATDVVAVIGGAFGWLREALEAEVPGITVAVTDTGTWIQSALNSTETSELSFIVDNAGWGVGSPEHTAIMAAIDDGGTRARVDVEDNAISNNGQRNQLTNKYGTFTWAITEQVAPWLEDSEMVVLNTNMAALAINTAHLTTPFMTKFLGMVAPSPSYNWKYLDALETAPMNPEQLANPWYTTRSWKTLLPNATILGPQGGMV